jgi:hypothetical protein
MRQLKVVLLSIAIGVAIGMWFGVNIGRGMPFYANPFDTGALNQKLKKVSGETLEKGGQALEKTGQALQENMSK